MSLKVQRSARRPIRLEGSEQEEGRVDDDDQEVREGVMYALYEDSAFDPGRRRVLHRDDLIILTVIQLLG